MNKTIAAWPHEMPYNEFILKVLKSIYTIEDQKGHEYKDLCADCIGKSPKELFKLFNRIKKKAYAPISKTYTKKERAVNGSKHGALILLFAYLNVAYDKVFPETFIDPDIIVPKVAIILNSKILPAITPVEINSEQMALKVKRVQDLSDRELNDPNGLSDEEAQEFLNLVAETNDYIVQYNNNQVPSIKPDQTT